MANLTELKKQIAQQKSASYLFKGFELKTIGLLVGTTKIGKSGFAQLMATQVAIGRDITGLGKSLTGKVSYLSFENTIRQLADKQEEINKDLSETEKELVDKNIDFVVLRHRQNEFRNEKAIDSLIEHCKGSKLIIVDHLSLWGDPEIESGAVAVGVTKSFTKMAEKLDACVIAVHHTNRTSEQKEKVSDVLMVGGSKKLVNQSQWVGLLKEEKKQLSFNLIASNNVENFSFNLDRRKDRAGILYPSTSKTTLNKNIQNNIIDIDSIGGKKPTTEIAPMNTGLIKTEGIFAAFSTRDERPKLDVKIVINENEKIHLHGPSMLSAKEARFLTALISLANGEGVRFLEGNSQLDFTTSENLRMRVNTSLNRIWGIISNSSFKCSGKSYAAMNKVLKNIQGCVVYYENSKYQTGFPLINSSRIDKENNSIEIDINTFLVRSLLGISQFTGISAKSARSIESDNGFLLYLKIKAVLRKTDSKGILFKEETLMRYLWSNGVISPAAFRKRRVRLKKALEDASKGGCLIIAEEKGNTRLWRIRDKLSVKEISSLS